MQQDAIEAQGRQIAKASVVVDEKQGQRLVKLLRAGHIPPPDCKSAL